MKSIDLPVVANSIRQLGESVLNDFVEYEVSRGPHVSDHEERDVNEEKPTFVPTASDDYPGQTGEGAE